MVPLYNEATIDITYDRVSHLANPFSGMEVIQLLKKASQTLKPHGRFALYGPQKDTHHNLWKATTLKAIGKDSGLELQEDYCLPDNTRLLVWEKAAA
jgi:hypothetical protein